MEDKKYAAVHQAPAQRRRGFQMMAESFGAREGDLVLALPDGWGFSLLSGARAIRLSP